MQRHISARNCHEQICNSPVNGFEGCNCHSSGKNIRLRFYVTRMPPTETYLACRFPRSNFVCKYSIVHAMAWDRVIASSRNCICTQWTHCSLNAWRNTPLCLQRQCHLHSTDSFLSSLEGGRGHVVQKRSTAILEHPCLGLASWDVDSEEIQAGFFKESRSGQGESPIGVIQLVTIFYRCKRNDGAQISCMLFTHIPPVSQGQLDPLV